MDSLAFYTDTNVDKAVATQLRSRGVIVVRCEEVGMAEADDAVHLTYAAEHGLALITKDADFRDLHYDWIEQSRVHGGIFFCKDRHKKSIGAIVEACFSFWELIESGAGTVEDIRNRLFLVCEG